MGDIVSSIDDALANGISQIGSAAADAGSASLDGYTAQTLYPVVQQQQQQNLSSLLVFGGLAYLAWKVLK